MNKYMNMLKLLCCNQLL